MNSVNVIKEMGYSVRFEHWRPRRFGDSLRLCRYMRGVTKWEPHPRGGWTFCAVLRNGEEVAVVTGEASCSMRDSFCYRLGLSRRAVP
jgi:hypothetical protein